ncbi:glycosyltransferase [Methanocella conradii]|uniref:glycosyltransferase n=1 Tax=Methanocella conradii TaxID=1175444 RepID=UPI0024B3B0C2|nr:glycosyltransferase [Methanocella conradii]MDI6896844.1 glycosyltransferase [Methanocella conradii]
MKVAIFHDYFSFIGGGEKLVLTLARHLGADIITTNVDRALISRMGFHDVNIISLGRLTRIEPLKQIQATLKFATCDFRGKYDFYIFSGNWAHHASRKHRPNLYYCHGHVRVFYDLKESTISSIKPLPARLAARAWIAVHGHFDRISLQRICLIVSNSRSVAHRLKRYLDKESVVVYPPIDTSRFHYDGDAGYWLSVNRLFPEKRVEVQLEAFRRMPEERLLIIGGSDRGDYSGSYARKIMESLPPNVTVLSDVSEDELASYYGRCRGFISTSMDEPFGMTAVEAMASGKPVIAPKEGGYLESIIDGETGLLIECTPEALIKAVKTISKDPYKYREACIEQAKKFDVSIFIKNIEELIHAGLGDRG